MRLSLVIKSYKGSPPTTGGRKQLSPSGGTIGRAADNDVVLADPERFVSGCHARVRAQDGEFYLDDLSRNGLFLNGATEPLGRTRSARLRHADVLTIGDYEIVVELEESAGGPSADPFAGPARSTPIGPDRSRPVAAVSDKPLDPLDLLGGGSPPPSNPSAGSQSDHVPPESRHFEPPRAVVDPSAPRPAPPPPRPVQPPAKVGGIPDDWDRTGLADSPPNPPSVRPPGNAGGIPDDWDRTGMAPAEPPPRSPSAHDTLPDDWDRSGPTGASAESGPIGAGAGLPGDWDLTERGVAPPPEPERTPAPVPPQVAETAGASGDAFAARLLEAAGLGGQGTSNPEVIGRLVADLAAGYVDLLAARASFKNELRVEATTIQPVENNPLKFSGSGAEALGHLLFPRGTGFSGPTESVGEAVRDLQDHQVAMIAAMRAALDALLQRLDPDALEARSDEGKSRLGLSGKGRYWEAYREMMSRLREDPDAFFKEMFAEEFARAYERQIELLSKSGR